MKVNLKLMQPLSGLVGAKDLSLEIEGDTLGDLVAQLSREHGPEVAGELLDQGGGLDLAYAVSVDGQLTRSLTSKLREGAEVLIFASIVGGTGVPQEE